MRRWIDVHNSGDLRHLLYEYDESVDNNTLIGAYEAIMNEDEKITDNNAYGVHLQNSDKIVWDGYYINAISLTMQCLEFGRKDLAQELIDDFKLKVKLDKKKIIDKKAIDTLDRLIKSIGNRHKMKNLRDNAEKKKEVSWEEMQVYIQEALGILPEYNCTVALFRNYEKSAKRKLELQKQAK